MYSEADLPETLLKIVNESLSFDPELQSEVLWNGSITTVEMNLRESIVKEPNRSRKAAIHANVQKYIQHFATSTSFKKEGATQVAVYQNKENNEVFMSLFPPRSRGESIRLPGVLAALKKAGVKEKINSHLVERAYTTIMKRDECIWRLPIHTQKISEETNQLSPSEQSHSHFTIPIFDTDRIFHEGQWAIEHPLEGLEIVSPGDLIGNNFSRNPGQLSGIIQRGGQLFAEQEGVVVKEDRDLSIIPFYLVLKDLNASNKNIDVDGTLYIKGNVKGPINLKASDIYIEGNIEEVNIVAEGNVYIKGGVAGRNRTQITCEGNFYSRFISDCNVRVFGNVKIKEAATYSNIICSGSIKVLSKQGQIVGGAAQALQEVACASYGSDFGTLTKVHVGHDFLTEVSLGEIRQEMSLHQDNINKINQLKKTLSQSNFNPKNLPPEKKDIYLSVLEKERNSKRLLDNLERRRRRYEKHLRQFLGACIRVIDHLSPPVEVKVYNIVKEIQNHLDQVVLELDESKQLTITPMKESEK